MDEKIDVVSLIRDLSGAVNNNNPNVKFSLQTLSFMLKVTRNFINQRAIKEADRLDRQEKIKFNDHLDDSKTQINEMGFAFAKSYIKRDLETAKHGKRIPVSKLDFSKINPTDKKNVYVKEASNFFKNHKGEFLLENSEQTFLDRVCNPNYMSGYLERCYLKDVGYINNLALEVSNSNTTRATIENQNWIALITHEARIQTTKANLLESRKRFQSILENHGNFLNLNQADLESGNSVVHANLSHANKSELLKLQEHSTGSGSGSGGFMNSKTVQLPTYVVDISQVNKERFSLSRGGDEALVYTSKQLLNLIKDSKISEQSLIYRVHNNKPTFRGSNKQNELKLLINHFNSLLESFEVFFRSDYEFLTLQFNNLQQQVSLTNKLRHDVARTNTEPMMLLSQQKKRGMEESLSPSDQKKEHKNREIRDLESVLFQNYEHLFLDSNSRMTNFSENVEKTTKKTLDEEKAMLTLQEAFVKRDLFLQYQNDVLTFKRDFIHQLEKLNVSQKSEYNPNQHSLLSLSAGSTSGTFTQNDSSSSDVVVPRLDLQAGPSLQVQNNQTPVQPLPGLGFLPTQPRGRSASYPPTPQTFIQVESTTLGLSPSQLQGPTSTANYSPISRTGTGKHILLSNLRRPVGTCQVVANPSSLLPLPPPPPSPPPG